MLALQAIRIELGKSYRQTVDLLSQMPGILEELGLTRFPHFTVLLVRDHPDGDLPSVSRRQPRNAVVTPQSTQLDSTATSLQATTPSERHQFRRPAAGVDFRVAEGVGLLVDETGLSALAVAPAWVELWARLVRIRIVGIARVLAGDFGDVDVLDGLVNVFFERRNGPTFEGTIEFLKSLLASLW